MGVGSIPIAMPMLMSHTHLVSLQECLSPTHIFGELIGRYQCMHGTEPGSEVPVLAQEPLEVRGVHQLVLTSLRLEGERRLEETVGGGVTMRKREKGRGGEKVLRNGIAACVCVCTHA